MRARMVGLNCIEVDGEKFSTDPYSGTTKELNPYCDKRRQREVEQARQILAKKLLKIRNQNSDFNLEIKSVSEDVP